MRPNQDEPLPLTDLRFGISSPEGDDLGVLASQSTRYILAEYQAFLAEQERRRTALTALRDEARKSIASFLGTRRAEALQQFRAQHRHPALHLPVTHPHDVLTAAQDERYRESQQLLRELNISVEDLRSLRRDWRMHQVKLAEPRVVNDAGVRIVAERDVPDDVVRRRTNPWTIKEPPFSVSYWYYDWKTWGSGTLKFGESIHKSTGGIGHWSNYTNYDSGNWDLLYLHITTSLAFWHKPKSGGNTDIWVKLKADVSGYFVNLWNESGWSDSDTHMWSLVAMEVLGVPGTKSQTQLWEYHIYGSDSKYYADAVAKAPDVVWLHFVKPLPPGAWSLLRISTVDERHTGTDDVSTNQDMLNRWFIEEVHVSD